jgi:Na+/melibiose symporter-like transporter
MIGIGILIATVPAVLMAIGAIIGTRILLTSEMFKSKA